MSDVKYPDIEVEMVGQDGNAMAIMARVRKELKLHGVPKNDIEKFTKEAMSGDYDNVLQTVMRWVNVS